MAKPSVVAFVDLQMTDGHQWDKAKTEREQDQGWFTANENHAEYIW